MAQRPTEERRLFNGNFVKKAGAAGESRWDASLTRAPAETHGIHLIFSRIHLLLTSHFSRLAFGVRRSAFGWRSQDRRYRVSLTSHLSPLTSHLSPLTDRSACPFAASLSARPAADSRTPDSMAVDSRAAGSRAVDRA